MSGYTSVRTNITIKYHSRKEQKIKIQYKIRHSRADLLALLREFSHQQIINHKYKQLKILFETINKSEICNKNRINEP